MCTVSYVPQQEGYTLTFNRDEAPTRTAEAPKKRILKNGLVIRAPKDLRKGGTWIAIDAKGRTACLLNGGFTKHTRKKEYRKSRGYIVIDAFEAASFNEFLATTFLEDMEPFTLLLIAPNSIQQLVWDGTKRNIHPLAPKSIHLWSSATLYGPEEHSSKTKYFEEALSDNGSDQEQILEIHGIERNTPFVINREKIKTVSITQHHYKGQESKLTYHVKQQSDEKITAPSSALYRS